MVANTEESRCNWRRTDYVNYTEGIGITYHGFEPEDEPERIDYIYIKIPKSIWLGDLLILEIIIPNKFLLHLFFVIHCITM